MTSLPFQLLGPPKSTDDKYSRGVVGFVTGSVDYPGSAVLGVRAAQSCGIGMIRYLGPVSVRHLVLESAPEVVTLAGKANAWVFGSGVGINDGNQLENFKQAAAKVSVLDAGALEVTAFPIFTETIITPHAAEAARLLTRLGQITTRNEVEADPLASAKRLNAITGATVLLKGNRVAIADDLYSRVLEPSPTELATAGTGDVLAGILGTLLARKVALGVEISLLDMCELAVSIQSQAAKLALVEGPVSAMDVARKIRQAVNILVS